MVIANQLGTRMYNSSVRMQKIVDDLLDFIRTRVGGKLPMHAEDADIAHICEQVAEECRAAHPGVVIHTQYEGDLTGKWDPVHIAQVYQNLINNAIQYGSEPRISVATLHCAGSHCAIFRRILVSCPNQWHATVFMTSNTGWRAGY